MDSNVWKYFGKYTKINFTVYKGDNQNYKFRIIKVEY